MLFGRGTFFCKNFKDSKIRNTAVFANFQNAIIEENNNYDSDRIRDLLKISKKTHIKSLNELKEISKELNAVEREKITELSRRLQLLNNSHELRLLRSQLRSARVGHENMEQKRDNDKIMQDALKQKEKEIMEERLGYQKAMESLAREREEERQKKVKLMGALKQQIDELQQRRYEEKQANLKEGKIMQEKLKAMKLEDQAERERLKRKRLKVRQEMEESLHEYEEKKRLKYVEHTNYIEQLQMYQEEKDQLNAKLEDERRRIRKERQSLSERMGNYLLNIHKESNEHTEFLTDLLIEERNTKESEVLRKNIAIHNATRLSLYNDLELYFNVIKPQKEMHLREKNRLSSIKRLEHLEKLDKTMKMEADQQHRNNLEYGNILKSLMEIKRQEIVKEKAQAQKQKEMLIAAEKQYDKLIDIEAARMINSQPPEVLHYLPTKLLKPSYITELKSQNSAQT